MKYTDLILPEFDAEMASTRKVLERVPEDKWDWKPHPKSNTTGWNANHVAEMPGWVEGIIAADSWDFAPVGGPAYESPAFKKRQEVLDLFDRGVVSGRKALAAVRDDQLGVKWSLLQAGNPIVTMPRFMVIRSFVINHTVHHRAILCVYLRLNNVPVPGMYGPSGDE